MSAKYPAVYALLRERMADDNDIPDTDEIIAAALDAARDAVAALTEVQHADFAGYYINTQSALAAIDALRSES